MRLPSRQVLAQIKGSPTLVFLLATTLLPFLDASLCWLFSFSPFFMDSIFTSIAAAVFGPLPGILTAIFASGYTELFHGFSGRNIPFAICGAATALIVWSFSRGRKLWPPLSIGLCIIAVSGANALLGALITTFVFGGGIGVKIDTLAAGFALLTDSDFLAALLARIPVNVIDKSVAVIPALLLARSIGNMESDAVVSRQDGEARTIG